MERGLSPECWQGANVDRSRSRNTQQNSKHRGERLELILSKYMSRHWALRPASIRELCTIVNLMCCRKGELFGMVLRGQSTKKNSTLFIRQEKRQEHPPMRILPDPRVMERGDQHSGTKGLGGSKILYGKEETTANKHPLIGIIIAALGFHFGGLKPNLPFIQLSVHLIEI